MPRGGIIMAETTEENGYEPDPAVHEIFKIRYNCKRWYLPRLHF